MNYYFFEKIRFASQKHNFSIFVFLAKKSVKMTLNSLEVQNVAKTNLFYFHFTVFKFF